MADPKFLRPVTAPGADIGQAVQFGPDQALTLDAGRTLAPWTIAYMTYGDAECRHAAMPCWSAML